MATFNTLATTIGDLAQGAYDSNKSAAAANDPKSMMEAAITAGRKNSQANSVAQNEKKVHQTIGQA